MPEEATTIEEQVFSTEEETSVPEQPAATEPSQTDTPVDDATQPPETPTAEEAQVAAQADAPVDEKFYQTSYQKAMDKLKEVAPAEYDSFRTDLKAERTQQPQEVVTPEPTEAEFIGDMTKDKFQELIRETSQQGYLQVQQEERARQEFVTADQALQEFVRTENIPRETLAQAYQYATGLGINPKAVGGASAVVRVIVDKLQSDAMRDHFNVKVSAAGAQASERAKMAAQVAQPEGSAIPEARTLTKDEKFLEDMNKVSGNAAEAELLA